MGAIGQFGGIALTLASLAALLGWLRRKGVAQWRSSGAVRSIEVIESRGLGPGHTLHLVRVADRCMALATHSSGCTLLEARPWDEMHNAPTPEVRR